MTKPHLALSTRKEIGRVLLLRIADTPILPRRSGQSSLKRPEEQSGGKPKRIFQADEIKPPGRCAWCIGLFCFHYENALTVASVQHVMPRGKETKCLHSVTCLSANRVCDGAFVWLPCFTRYQAASGHLLCLVHTLALLYRVSCTAWTWPLDGPCYSQPHEFHVVHVPAHVPVLRCMGVT